MYHDRAVVDVLRVFTEGYTQKMKLNDVQQLDLLNRDILGARPDK